MNDQTPSAPEHKSLPTISPMEQPIRVNNRSAVAAGVCGIGSILAQLLGLALGAANQSTLSLCNGIGGLAWIAGIVFGILGLVQIRRHPGQKGTGWALAGIGLGLLRVCIVTVLLLIAPSAAALPR